MKYINRVGIVVIVERIKLIIGASALIKALTAYILVDMYDMMFIPIILGLTLIIDLYLVSRLDHISLRCN